MEHFGTYTISLDTPISMLTPRQLFAMMPKPEEKPASVDKRRWYVNSMDELASILGTSVSTVYRMKREGLLDDCISQCGKWVMIDVDGVIEKFKLSNRRRKRR